MWGQMGGTSDGGTHERTERSASGREGVLAVLGGSLAQRSSYGLISSLLEGGIGGGTFVLFVIS